MGRSNPQQEKAPARMAAGSACPWTTRLLQSLGRFEAAAGPFYRRNIPPSTKKAGEPSGLREEQFLEFEEQFLFRMSASPDPLVSAMARLELALMRVKQGSADEYLVYWDRNPELVFRALREGGNLPVAEPGCFHETYISRDIPGLVSWRAAPQSRFQERCGQRTPSPYGLG